MKHTPFLILLAFLIFNYTAQSQSWIVNNNSQVHLLSGTYVVVEGNVLNNNNGAFDNSGTIQLTGNWTNNAGNTAFVNSSPGTVVLNGSNQLVNGTDSTVFYNLSLEGTGSKQIGVNTSVEGVLALNDKELITNNFGLFVFNSNIAAITRTTGFVSSTGNGFLSRATLRPFGPSVTFTTFAKIFTPLINDSRASLLNLICFAIYFFFRIAFQ